MKGGRGLREAEDEGRQRMKGISIAEQLIAKLSVPNSITVV
jgi:hypothetical protein